ncbi:MAG: beta-N-acetylhexosaminidase [Firmicutes bacterium]|nr:beta-N-acetylhexosaminidase [Bacillota bacterium]
MKRRYLIVIAIILLLALGYFFPIILTNISPVWPDIQLGNDKAIADKIKQMALAEKIGQLVLVGMEGIAINEDITDLIVRQHVGGVILYKKNITNSTQLLDLLNSLKEANAANTIPLFLAVDEEGGRISRLPDELKNLPNNQTVGEVNNPTFAYEIGQVLAAELKAYGFNLNFAPVLDINSNPLNPVIGDRSYGSMPDTVSRLGLQSIKGMQEGGLIAVAKHFPGHGDTEVDSHVRLPVLNFDLSRLDEFELVPFKTAIAGHVDAIMIAHILLPKIDPQYPASLSKKIITDLLKERLNFTGLVVTDDLTMGAIVENYSLEDAAVQALKAGSDLLLVCHDVQGQFKVLEAIKQAVVSGAISEAQIDKSVFKILKLKQKYNLNEQVITSVDVASLNERIEFLLQTYLKQD